MLKRLFDVIASSIGLLLLLPLLIIISIWVKLDSAGPIFFRQTRVGRFGTSFRIHKFRTMKVDSETQGRLTIGADPRITRSGHFSTQN
ncbi:MAG: sugar transferase [Glaciecola sp.]